MNHRRVLTVCCEALTTVHRGLLGAHAVSLLLGCAIIDGR